MAAADPRELVRLEEAGESRLGGWAWAPERAEPSSSLLVAVHGISRDAEGLARALQPTAASRGWALLAPEFREDRHADYQRLGRVGRGPRADHAIDSLIASCADRFGRSFGRRFLFGFSAGGQFVHRYLMAHPERVDAAVVGAPGWFTFPDPTRAYPYGIRVGRELPGIRMVPREFLRTPVLLGVGDCDVERDPNLRQGRTIDRLQGEDRLERAVRWAQVMNGLARRYELAEPVRLRIWKGVGHDVAKNLAAGLAAEMESFLAGCEAAGTAPADAGAERHAPLQEENPDV